MKKMNTRFVVALALGVLSVSSVFAGGWWDSPVVLKKIARNAVKDDDPHFMSKSADNSLLLINLQAIQDKAPTVLVNMNELVDPATDSPAVRTLVNRPSEAYGEHWKGGAISTDLGLALFGSAVSSSTCVAAIDGDVWLKASSFKPLQTSNGDVIDGLAFGTGSKYVYSNVYTEGRRGKIVRWSYSAAENKLVLAGEYDTGLTRVQNIAVYRVDGKELVYCGEGGGSSAKIVAIDVSDVNAANWVLYTVANAISKDSLTLAGNLTNVKLSGADTDAPVMYACGDDGRCGCLSLDDERTGHRRCDG